MPAPRPTSADEVPLGELVSLVGATLSSSVPSSPAGVGGVTGVSLDSRTVQPGDLYAALPGFATHGASFVPEAVAAGAVAVLTDPAGDSMLTQMGVTGLPVLVTTEPRAVLGDLAAVVYGRPADALRLIGVTGTNGKTTTAYLIEAALRALGARTGLMGTVETRIGNERLKSSRTTPEATELHALLALMRERDATDVVMEVSSHALAQHRVDGAVFDVALFTNLSQDHLDFHGSMEDYFAAKARLFTPEHARRGVVCVDDPWGVRLAAQATVPVVTLGSHLGAVADWSVRARTWPELVLTGPQGSVTLKCHLPGEFNVVNTAMAAVALVEVGYPFSDVAPAMGREPVVPGRMELVTATHPDPERDPRGIVDYAHTPDAVEAALRALRSSTPGRLVVVLGAGGDRDRGKRRAMGAAARRWADDVIVSDDNPRSEDPSAIRSEIIEGMQDVLAYDADTGRGRRGPRTAKSSTAGRGVHIANAVAAARRDGRAGDNTVVVLGKGHETGQEIAGVVHPFDDRDALRAALDGLDYRPEAT